ncbi:MAG: polyamine aminopropyltransferase [Candidatus Omnitrophica bacterium]|nr:polyamine aminopropyltransferase [Candidatus Omnitrophota bacterium]
MSWFHETLYPDVRLGFNGRLLHRKKTAYQDLKIYKNHRFGKLMLLDNVIQTTENDEFIYHEMLTHPVLFAHPNPKDVLVIGAGDGGILREVLRHKVRHVDLVEIDTEVIRASKKYLPSLSKGAFCDKRLSIILDDGARFVRDKSKEFDIVIVDSPDPVGPAKVLFGKKFYKDIFSILKNRGIMIRQAGSSMLQQDELKQNYKLLKKIFPSVTIGLAAIPTYIGGFFSFLIGAKGINFQGLSFRKIESRYKKLNLKTKYYNPQIHFASSKLPSYLRGIVNGKK